MPRLKLGLDAYGNKRPKKDDLTVNPKIDKHILHEFDRGKVPLRIHKGLTIYVTPEKCNAEYAAEYLEKIEKVKQRDIVTLTRLY